MLKAYCDNCGKEIEVSSANELSLKIVKFPCYIHTCFKGTFCKECRNKIQKIIRVLAHRYSMQKDN